LEERGYTADICFLFLNIRRVNSVGVPWEEEGIGHKLIKRKNGE
jgi:hypothetical protein